MLIETALNQHSAIDNQHFSRVVSTYGIKVLPPNRRKLPSLALLAAELSLGFQPVVERRSAVSSARLVDLVGKPRNFLLGDLGWRWRWLMVADSTRPLGAKGGALLGVLWCSWHSSPLTSFLVPVFTDTNVLGEVDFRRFCRFTHATQDRTLPQPGANFRG
jgi:hypothetical protein